MSWMIKAVIFDIDGVLLDSDKGIVDAYQKAGRAFGLKVPDKDFFRTRLGIPYNIIIEEAYGKNEEVMKLFRKFELGMEFPLIPNAKSVLQKINLPKGVVTTKSRITVEKFLKDLVKYFQVIVTLEDTQKHKPDPEPLLLACKKLGVKPEEAVYVGDMVRDYETARNAGVKFIGFLSYGSTREEFAKAGVKDLIDSLLELPKILKSN